VCIKSLWTSNTKIGTQTVHQRKSADWYEKAQENKARRTARGTTLMRFFPKETMKRNKFVKR
jgi:hypothetical protein